MSDDFSAGNFTSCGITAGGNHQHGTLGLSVQGRARDVHYYAAPCDHQCAAAGARHTSGFSPVPYETLREDLHRIVRVCSRIVDDLRDDTDESGGTAWD
ncbi:hypothetical protein PUR61_40935 [Streptomyces sp. BE20]|uniref:hypothetical protein n=1 Tax=Streptomyces sp. BE20 TaxID=3002525 RepID=UPI002E7A6EDE|nr:hypothetical protein [Streptomyces sp. BE20]MEE1828488.1 hypothetical protein [Streptomyces sp. BE20]